MKKAVGYLTDKGAFYETHEEAAFFDALDKLEEAAATHLRSVITDASNAVDFINDNVEVVQEYCRAHRGYYENENTQYTKNEKKVKTNTGQSGS